MSADDEKISKLRTRIYTEKHSLYLLQNNTFKTYFQGKKRFVDNLPKTIYTKLTRRLEMIGDIEDLYLTYLALLKTRYVNSVNKDENSKVIANIESEVMFYREHKDKYLKLLSKYEEEINKRLEGKSEPYKEVYMLYFIKGNTTVETTKKSKLSEADVIQIKRQIEEDIQYGFI